MAICPQADNGSQCDRLGVGTPLRSPRVPYCALTVEGTGSQILIAHRSADWRASKKQKRSILHVMTETEIRMLLTLQNSESGTRVAMLELETDGIEVLVPNSHMDGLAQLGRNWARTVVGPGMRVLRASLTSRVLSRIRVA